MQKKIDRFNQISTDTMFHVFVRVEDLDQQEAYIKQLEIGKKELIKKIVELNNIRIENIPEMIRWRKNIFIYIHQITGKTLQELKEECG